MRGFSAAFLFKMLAQLNQIRWRRYDKFAVVVLNRVAKCDAGCMQRLPSHDPVQVAVSPLLLRIDRLSNKRAAEMKHMHPDLMCSSGNQTQTELGAS